MITILYYFLVLIGKSGIVSNSRLVNVITFRVFFNSSFSLVNRPIVSSFVCKIKIRTSIHLVKLARKTTDRNSLVGNLRNVSRVSFNNAILDLSKSNFKTNLSKIRSNVLSIITGSKNGFVNCCNIQIINCSNRFIGNIEYIHIKIYTNVCCSFHLLQISDWV